MSANAFLTNVPKLLGRENYHEWAFAAENLLVLEGMSDCIKQESPEAKRNEDKKAMAKLILTIDPSLYVHIKESKSTKDLWQKIKTMFDDSGFSRRITLLRNLISIRLDGCQSVTSYVTEIIETAQKLSGTGFCVSDEWIGCLMLAGLPEKYFPMIMAIEHSGIAITADVVKTKIIDLAGNEREAASSAFLSRGHHSKNLKVKNNFSQYGGEKSMTDSSYVKSDKSKVKCYRCKKLGHYKSQCKENMQAIKKTNAFSAVFLSNNYNKQDFYLDSGASVHMTPHKDMIRNASNSSIKEIIVANQSTMPVLCSGDVNIITVTANCKYEVTLKDVLCVPNLTTNLISISQLIRNGNTVDFKGNVCYIYNRKNILVGVAKETNGVYKLEQEQKQCLFTMTSSAASSKVWHRRLGHININDQNKMREGAVKGIAYTDKCVINKNTCSVCCEGKQSRLPFGHIGTRSSGPLDIVHSDVCGPMEVTSIGGARYFLIFVDDFTRMTFIYFLREKSEVFKYFKEYKVLVENQQDRKMKIFRTDNGLEFCSNIFENFLKESGIIHQKTNAYTPEQNGLSERVNRTIVERARCLLFDSGLDKKFWAEAANTAVYLKNRSIATGLNKTPYELWTNIKPDLSHIRIFGSKVMVHIPKEKRLKWDKKSKNQILVGYADNVKGYRVYDMTKRYITTSRDVVIHESTEGNQIDSKSDSVSSVSVGDNFQSENSSSCNSKDNEKLSTDVTNNDVTQEEYLTDLNDSSESEYTNALTDLDSTLQQSMISEEEGLPESPETISPKRTRKQPERFGFINLCTTSSLDLSRDPINVQEAFNSPDRDKWIEAMQDELQAFEENDAWVTVEELPSNKTLVQYKWVFKKKVNSDKCVRYRARLVAKGFTQRPGVDYDETFSPVVRHSTIKLLFALSVQLNFDITHLDVKTAFLNGYLKEDIYMIKPDINSDKNKKVIVKLNKAIYGLKQSSRSWYERVEQCLYKLDFKKSKLEPCIFTKMYNGVKIIIALYVDDFFVFSNCKEETNKLISVLSSNFKIKNLGQVQHCLGVRVKIDKNSNVITLDQEQYVEQLLDKFNMLNCKVASTPMECKLNLDKSETCDLETPYQQLIGSLMYLSVLTRPDISYCVSFLSQFNKCHTNIHWNCAKRILRYLKKTKNYCLKYVKEKSELVGFVDADWASNSVDRKSYTGYCFTMSGSAVSWESKKQRTVALSSMEAEYMSIAEASKEAIYLRSLLCELTGKLYTIPVYNDSQSAQQLVANYVCHRKSKHIDIRYHFVKDVVNSKIINLEYLPTSAMPADILTKGLSPAKHYKCIKGLGISQIES